MIYQLERAIYTLKPGGELNDRKSFTKDEAEHYIEDKRLATITREALIEIVRLLRE